MESVSGLRDMLEKGIFEAEKIAYQGSKIDVCSPIIMLACRMREPFPQFIIILSGICTSTSPVFTSTAFTTSDSCHCADVRRDRDDRYAFGRADLLLNKKTVEKRQTKTSHLVFFLNGAIITRGRSFSAKLSIQFPKHNELVAEIAAWYLYT